MLDKQQEAVVRAQFGEVKDGAWCRWLMGEIRAKREAALQRMEDSNDAEEMMRHKTELKTLREVINLLSKFENAR